MRDPSCDKSLPLPEYTPSLQPLRPSPPPAHAVRQHQPESTTAPDLAALLCSSPPIPSEPAPAYTALPYRDVQFHLAPLVLGRLGDIDLETTDGKRFLVHRKVLEHETVFFHIYYGFVPVWRLSTPHVGPPHPNLPPAPHLPAQSIAISNLLYLPKLFASHLRQAQPQGHTATATAITASSSPSERSGSEASYPSDTTPPRVPPKDVMAPTPTTDPYTWAVPESSTILAAFLALVYPRGVLTTTYEAVLPTLDITAKVIRAAMGYQCSRAVGIARDRLHAFVEHDPVMTYATACFFKYTDLARIASERTVKVGLDAWSSEARALAGRTGMAKITQLRSTRTRGIAQILDTPMETDQHSSTCVRTRMIEELWKAKVNEVKASTGPESMLLELLEIDLRGGHCGECLVLLGQTIQRSLFAAQALPRTI